MTFRKILFFMFLSFTAFSQGEGNVWYFGSGNGLNFNQSCDISDNSSSMNGVEGCVSLCNSEGELLFYTNGGRTAASSDITGAIWNKDHQLLYDMGTNEGGGASARQSSIAIPKVGSNSNYFLFTMDENEALFLGAGYRGLSYFEIDMSLNGGLGGVVDYKEKIFDGSAFGLTSPETLGGVKKPDGTGYWVVTFDLSSTQDELIKYFLVDQDGVKLDHTEPSPEAALALNNSPIKFSPNSEYVAYSNIIRRFDANAGKFGELLVDISSAVPNSNHVGTSFSPNSRYLFISGSNQIWQFDLEAEDVASSRTQVVEFSTNTVLGDLQLAPDGNIYTLSFDASSINQITLSVVLCPNSGNACILEGLDAYTGFFGQFGLPNFLDHYFASDAVEVGLDVCVEVESYQICEGEESTISVDHYLAQEITWSTGASSSSITISEPGTYSVTVSDGCCNEFIEEFQITGGDEVIDPVIEGPSSICDQQEVQLTTNLSASNNIIWSDGSTEPALTVSEPGIYSVTVTSECGGQSEELTTDFEILFAEDVEFELNVIGDLTCTGEVTAAISSDFDQVQWSTGATTNEISISNPGQYSLEVSNFCGSQEEIFTVDPADEIYEMPNAFTPDGDSVNDIFLPVWGSCSDVSNYFLAIYSRWGKQVFVSTDPKKGWNGNLNNKALNSEVYIYEMRFNVGNEVVRKAGDVTLIR